MISFTAGAILIAVSGLVTVRLGDIMIRALLGKEQNPNALGVALTVLFILSAFFTGVNML